MIVWASDPRLAGKEAELADVGEHAKPLGLARSPSDPRRASEAKWEGEPFPERERQPPGLRAKRRSHPNVVALSGDGIEQHGRGVAIAEDITCDEIQGARRSGI